MRFISKTYYFTQNSPYMKTFRKPLHARIASTVLGKLLLSGTLLGILNVQTVFERYQQLL